MASPEYDDSATVHGDITRNLYVLNNDPAGYSLESVAAADHGAAALTDGAVVFTPPAGFEGQASFDYVARHAAGDAIQATVRLQIEAADESELLLERFDSEPDIAASILYDRGDTVAEAARTSLLEAMKEDPWFARGFATLEAAISTERPVDLYVMLGDGLLEGTAPDGRFEGTAALFADELDRIWDNTPDQSNSNSILVLNCAAHNTSIVQWSNLHSPSTGLPPWVEQGRPGANLSEGCMFFLDWMLRDTAIPVALRGIVVGFGAFDAELALSDDKLLSAWPQHLRQLVDLYRGSYGTDLAVILVSPPSPFDVKGEIYANWDDIYISTRQFKTHNLSLINTQSWDKWTPNGSRTLLTEQGQRRLAQALASAAHERWMAEWPYTDPDSKPALGTTGECSRKTPCFPGTHYLIEPDTCEGSDYFRAGESGRFLCDQYGNSLHALAAGCNHCIDLEHVAGTLGVGIVKGKTGRRFHPGAYMSQSAGDSQLTPLPYQNPYIIEAPRPCGYQDRESSSFILAPGSYNYRVESRSDETCVAENPTACGLLQSPETALLDTFQAQLNVTAGECTEILVQQQFGEVLTCGQQITHDTVLGANMHCPEKLMDGLWIIEDGVTLDLNGYTIFGRPSPGFEEYGSSTAIKVHADNVTITNGVIEGWDGGVFGGWKEQGVHSTGLAINQLTIRNLEVSDNAHQLTGINLVKSHGVEIDSILFEFQSKFHSDGVGLWNADVVARGIRQFGGASAFTVGPWECDHENEPINVEFYDSIIKDAFHSSFFLQCINSASVKGNEFSWTAVPRDGAPAGLGADVPLPGSVKELRLSNNLIRGAVTGLDFAGVTDSIANQNYIIDSVYRGVVMGESILCAHQDTPGSEPLPDWFECFGASGNLISDNWVTSKWSSLTDLYASPRAHDNEWRGNTCETIDGESIPACLPEP